MSGQVFPPFGTIKHFATRKLLLFKFRWSIITGKLSNFSSPHFWTSFKAVYSEETRWKSPASTSTQMQLNEKVSTMLAASTDGTDIEIIQNTGSPSSLSVNIVSHSPDIRNHVHIISEKMNRLCQQCLIRMCDFFYFLVSFFPPIGLCMTVAIFSQISLSLRNTWVCFLR